jgi:hypothetical protein
VIDVPVGDAPVTRVVPPEGVAPKHLVHDSAPARRERPRSQNGEVVATGDATAPAPDATEEPAEANASDDVARLNVTVHDAAGGTAADARVLAFDPFSFMNAADEAEWTMTATTDAAGEATLEFKKEHSSFVQVIAERDGLAGLSDRVLRPTKAAETVDVVLSPAVRVFGTVTDTSGTPVVAARLVARLRTDSTMGFALTARSDERGNYALPGIPTSLLTRMQSVSAYAPGHTESNKVFEPVPREVRLDFVLEPGRTVIGRCVQAGGLPVPQARILWESEETQTGDDGSFELGVLPLWGGTITVIPESFAPVQVVVPPGPPGQADVGEIVVRPGESIAGKVIDRDGKPIANAQVSAHSNEFHHWLRSVTTGEDGRFEIAHLNQGVHRVTVMKQMRMGVQLEAPPAEVPADTRDLQLTLGGATSVLVKFLSSADRSVVKVADATISATSTETGARRATWGYAGLNLTEARISVETPGVYDVTVKIPGYDEGLAAGVVVVEGQETVIDVLFVKRPE